MMDEIPAMIEMIPARARKMAHNSSSPFKPATKPLNKLFSIS